MASNTFGTLFKITTWGESHGPSMGVVVDGCPAGLRLDIDQIQRALDRRKPGRTAYVSPRAESDRVQIVSGVFEGMTTGTPIAMVIANEDAQSKHYDGVQQLLRPGHANATYLQKYGVFDPRGGGRASARETVCRVAAAAVAQQFLAYHGIQVCAYLETLGKIKMDQSIPADQLYLESEIDQSALFCPDKQTTLKMQRHLREVQAAGDSTGGAVRFCATGLPVGLGDPVYEKLEAKLAAAMMSIPATKGIEMGDGFGAISLLGSVHNDEPLSLAQTRSNHAGGLLGGISNGMPLYGRVAFKPTASINKPQKTVDLAGAPAEFAWPSGFRHDPCVAIRGVVVVQAMLSLVLADALLMQRCVGLL